MTAPIPNRPTHHFTQDDMKTWLAEYGLDISDVLEAAIKLGRPGHQPLLGAWLEVRWYLRNPAGNLYFDGTGETAAIGTATIPLASFPTLTATEEPAGGEPS